MCCSRLFSVKHYRTSFTKYDFECVPRLTAQYIMHVYKTTPIFTTNVSSNFLRSVSAKNFLCAKFYKHSSILRMTCTKYVPKHCLKENICVLQVLLCLHTCTAQRELCLQLRILTLSTAQNLLTCLKDRTVQRTPISAMFVIHNLNMFAR